MISFLKLRVELVKRGITWKQLIADTGISQDTARKFKYDNYADIKTIEKICIYLNLDIGDVCEIKRE